MSTQPRNTQTRNIIILIVAILLSCSLGYAMGSAGSGDNSTSARQSGDTSTVAQVATATATTPRPTNTPTATPKPQKWTTIHHFTGSGNTQTEAFDIQNGDRVVSNCSTNSEANLFIADLYEQGTSAGNGYPYAQLVDTANQPCSSQTYTIQEGDASVYLHVECDSIAWTVDIQHYQ